VAIHVSFFGGDPEAIFRCLESGGRPTKSSNSSCGGEVEFKFGFMPEKAFNALMVSAARMTNARPFRFADCVSGQLAADGESFQGIVNTDFIELFSSIPRDRIADLAAEWTRDLGHLHEAEFPAAATRPRRWLDRIGSHIQTAIFSAVMYPILAICLLSPSLRKERAMNRKKWADQKPPVPPTNDELVEALVRMCAIARERGHAIVYTWHI